MIQPVRIITGDVLEGLASLEAGSVHCCVTSPPYWGLRDYGVDGQIGLEPSPDAYVARMVEVFREVRRCLREDGTLWLNLGDSYAGSWGAQSRGPTSEGTLEGHDMLSARQIEAAQRHASGTGSMKRTPGMKPKDLMMMPWRVALALQADGWWLRSVIVWAKKSPMPESVTDRPTSSWEPIFLLAKSSTYFYDAEAVKEAALGSDHPRHVVAPPDRSNGHMAVDRGIRSVDGRNGMGRNQRNVWHLGHEPYHEAHFATFPTEIPRRAIKAGTSEKGCCPACGKPWTRVVDRVDSGMKQKAADGWDTAPGAHGTIHREGRSKGETGKPVLMTTTLGWQASCECHDEHGRTLNPVPCTVLDPFLGSGTTVAVARELGRHGVGCEINPEYVKLARDRIGRAERPTTYRSEKVEDSPLFAECNP